MKKAVAGLVNMILIRCFVFIFVFCFLFLDLKIYANSIINEIMKLEKENWEIDKKNIDKVTFRLAENQSFSGYGAEKMFLEDSDGNKWLFSLYPLPVNIKNTEMVYRLAFLCGIELPIAREIILPVDGELRKGLLQSVLPDVIGLGVKDLINLSPLQMEFFFRSQILEWFVCNSDTDEDEFIVDKQNSRIICFDHDSSFDYEKKDISPIGEEYSVYNKFWRLYVKEKGNIEINFREILGLINYIRRLDDRILREMAEAVYYGDAFLEDREQIFRLLILRKNDLYSTFENLYQDMFKESGKKFEIKFSDKENSYSKEILERVLAIVFKKRLQFFQSQPKIIKKQENISVVFSDKAWYMVDELNYLSRDNFVSKVRDVNEKLKSLEKKTSDFCEKLAINFYIEKVNRIQRERKMTYFGEYRIKRVIMHPDKLGDLFDIEYNLRLSYGIPLKSLEKYKDKILKEQGDLITHFNYIQLPLDIIDDMDEEEKMKILMEYQKKQEEGSMYKVIYGLLLRDIDYFKNIDDDFAWKHIGLGLLYKLDKQKKKAMEEFKKVIILNNDQTSIYWSHILLANLYEYNDTWIKFGESFEIEKTISEYKKALEIVPDSIEAHLNLASLYLIKKLPKKALEEFKIVKNLDPYYTNEHFHLEKIKERNFYEGEEKYLEAVRMNTLSGENHYLLGLAYAVKKEKELARKHFNKAQEFGYEVEVNLNERN